MYQNFFVNFIGITFIPGHMYIDVDNENSWYSHWCQPFYFSKFWLFLCSDKEPVSAESHSSANNEYVQHAHHGLSLFCHFQINNSKIETR